MNDNENKYLKIIMGLAKAGKIISKIVLVCSIVGLVGSLVGLASIAVIPSSLKVGGVTIHSLIEKSAEITLPAIYAACITGAILSAGEIVVSKLAARYFINELVRGTPFTYEGAKEALRVGIFAIVVPVIALVLAEVAQAVVAHCMGDCGELEIGDYVSVGTGISFIVASVFFKYGAAVKENSKN